MLRKDLTSILIVEDEPSARMLMGRIAERYSNRIYYAQNGAEGIEVIEKHQPDIVISDIKMPRMDGLSMIQKIESLGIKKPIIILATAYSEAEYFVKAIELKVDHLLVKPIEADMLIEKIEKSINNIRNDIENRKLKSLVELQVKKINTIFNFQNNIVMLTDGENIRDANLAFLDFFGFNSLEEFTSSKIKMTDCFIHGENFIGPETNLPDVIQKLIRDTSVDNLVKMFDRLKDAERIFILKAATYPGEDMLYIVSFTDISEIENNRKLLRTLATTDKLTKIYNRFKFDEILSVETSRSRRYKTPLSIAVFDIDLFKSINDLYGHDIGDSLLEEVTTIVKSIIRTSDSFARWGGDEFAIILPNTKLENAYQLAEKIRTTIESHTFASKESVTISIGLAEYTEGESELEILKRADTMLYKAKHLGRNKTCYE